MKATCAFIVVLLMVVGAANAEVLLDDTFEIGYVDGPLIGQTAPNGQDWMPHPSYPVGSPLRGDYGMDPSKGAGHDLSRDNAESLAQNPFGRTVTAADPDNILFISLDLRGGSVPGIGPVGAGVYLVGLDSRMTAGSVNSGEGSVEHGLIGIGLPETYGHNTSMDSLADMTGWFHFEATVDLGLGEVTSSWYSYDDPGFNGSYSNQWDNYAYRFEPDRLVLSAYRYTDGADLGGPGPGVDNLYVEAVPDPATLSLSAIGALALLRRKRKWPLLVGGPAYTPNSKYLCLRGNLP